MTLMSRKSHSLSHSPFLLLFLYICWIWSRRALASLDSYVTVFLPGCMAISSSGCSISVFTFRPQTAKIDSALEFRFQIWEYKCQCQTNEDKQIFLNSTLKQNQPSQCSKNCMHSWMTESFTVIMCFAKFSIRDRKHLLA